MIRENNGVVLPMNKKPSKAEATRKRREAAARKQRNRRLLIVGVLGVVLLVWAVIAVNSPPPEELADVEVFADLGGGHLAEGDLAPTYNSDPPTSGPHSPVSTECGVYTSEVPDVTQVHNLEHGTVIIQYSPGLADSDVEAIGNFARSKPSHILVAPRSNLSDPVVVTSWRRMLKLGVVDLDVLNVYYGEFVRTGPEVGVPCAFTVDEST